MRKVRADCVGNRTEGKGGSNVICDWPLPGVLGISGMVFGERSHD